MYDILGSRELGDWVKVQSITWYSHFLMMQYNNLRGIGHFRVSKNFVHHLTKKLKHFMERNNMKTQVVVLVKVCVACSLYKLAHYSELFVIKKSIVHLVL